MNDNERQALESALKEAKQVAEDPKVKAYDDIDELFVDLKKVNPLS